MIFWNDVLAINDVAIRNSYPKILIVINFVLLLP